MIASTLAGRPLPAVNIRALQERKRLEAELLSVETQLRNFTRLRDRLAASGQDANARYRALRARSDELMSALGKAVPRGKPGKPRAAGQGPDTSRPAAPIAPGRLAGLFGGVRPGSSGFVQLGPAADGVNVVAQGQYPTSGEIETVPGSYPGVVTFWGDLTVGSDAAAQFDPTISYFWLRTWTYLIAFPPADVLSLFTYRFESAALCSVFFEGLEGTFMAFVSVGETANLLTGESIPVDIGAGWPLIADLTQPGPLYNGHYGEILGQATPFQHSFMVGGGEVPGVAIAVGAVVGLSMGSQANLIPFDQYSEIGIGSQGHGTSIAYSYEPQLVIAQ